MSVEFGLTPDTNWIGRVGRLDLDDLGTHIAEQTGAEWPGDQGSDLEHPDSVQGAGSIHRPVREKLCRTSQSVMIPTAFFSVSR